MDVFVEVLQFLLLMAFFWGYMEIVKRLLFTHFYDPLFNTRQWLWQGKVIKWLMENKLPEPETFALRNGVVVWHKFRFKLGVLNYTPADSSANGYSYVDFITPENTYGFISPRFSNRLGGQRYRKLLNLVELRLADLDEGEE